MARDEGSVARGALRALALKAWRHEPVRRVLRPFVRRRVPARRWVFLVGCYGSGTTLAKRLLCAHPEIRTLPVEGVRLTGALPAPEDFGWRRMWHECEEEMVPKDSTAARTAVADWSPWWGPSGGAAFLEKSVANSARIPWLHDNFEDARFVGIVRDGYRVSESIRRKARPTGDVARKLGPCYSVSLCAGQWVATNTRLLEAAERVEGFAWIQYENLVESPAEVLTSVWSSIGLDPVPVHDGPGWVEISGQRFPLRDTNPEGLARLAPEDVEELAPILGPMQERLGYPERP